MCTSPQRQARSEMVAMGTSPEQQPCSSVLEPVEFSEFDPSHVSLVDEWSNCSDREGHASLASLVSSTEDASKWPDAAPIGGNTAGCGVRRMVGPATGAVLKPLGGTEGADRTNFKSERAMYASQSGDWGSDAETSSLSATSEVEEVGSGSASNAELEALVETAAPKNVGDMPHPRSPAIPEAVDRPVCALEQDDECYATFGEAEGNTKEMTQKWQKWNERKAQRKERKERGGKSARTKAAILEVACLLTPSGSRYASTHSASSSDSGYTERKRLSCSSQGSRTSTAGSLESIVFELAQNFSQRQEDGSWHVDGEACRSDFREWH